MGKDRLLVTASKLAARPAHVHPSLVAEVDLYNVPGLVDGASFDIHRHWKDVQDTSPDVFWTPYNGGHWCAARYADIASISADAENFSNCDIFVPQGSAPKQTPVNVDPPEHGGFRKLLMPTFTPAMLAKAEESARAAAISLIEKIKPRGECEFVHDFSKVVPTIALMTLLNLPVDDLDYLVSIAGRLTPGDPESPQYWAKVSAYVQDQIEDRRKNPRGDYISSLFGATVYGREITDQEIFDMALMLIAGGLDTVAVSLSFTASFLAQSPSHRRQLIEDPSLVEKAAEELMRRFGIASVGRVAAKDVEISGATIKAGESVILIYPLAGLDERANDQPLTVDFNRKGGKHLLFGTGIHTCVGNRLAKRELRLFLREWLARIPDFSIAPGTTPKVHSGVLTEIEDLRLVWEN
jgi:cytochrome P450